jgi:hypothetical protein
MTASKLLRTVVFGAMLASACTASRARTETVTAQRLKDSTPERSAALRAATPGLEAEDDRWGIEAAKERKRIGDPRARNLQPPPPLAGSATIDVKTPTNP